MKLFTPAQTYKSVNPRSAIIVLVSLFLLWYTVYKSGLTWQYLALSGPQAVYFISATLVMLFSVWLQSVRNKVLWEPWFPDKKKVDTFNGLALGNLYNCLLPGNLGEGVRAWHFSNKNRVSFIRALAAIGAEKYIDGVVFLFYLPFILWVYPNLHSNMYIISAFAVVFAIAIIYMLIISFRPIEKLFGKLLLQFSKTGAWLYKLYYHVKIFLKKLTALSLSRYVILSYPVFFLNIVQYYLVMKATGLPPPVGEFYGAFFVAVAMVIIAIIPSAPGNVGVLHYGIYSLLIFTAGVNGIAPGSALLQTYARYAIYLHLSYFLPEVVLGFIILLKEKRWLLN